MFNLTAIIDELIFETSRSGGKGGQNVNKVETKVSLVWGFECSNHLSEVEKELIKQNGKSFLFKGGLRITSQKSRSQLQNKQNAITKLQNLLEEWLTVEKERRPTKVPKSIIERRLKTKKNKSDIKKNRGKINLDE
jgi:ribosome-associated protein